MLQPPAVLASQWRENPEEEVIENRVKKYAFLAKEFSHM